jgi:hypothetical protein
MRRWWGDGRRVAAPPLFYGAICTWPLPPLMDGGSPLKIVVNALATYE